MTGGGRFLRPFPEFWVERREYASRWIDGSLRTPGEVWVEADVIETTLYLPVKTTELLNKTDIMSTLDPSWNQLNIEIIRINYIFHQSFNC